MARLLPTLALVALCTLVGCRTSGPAAGPDDVTALQNRVDRLETLTDSLSRAAFLRNPNLHSTLWAQTAVEYEGIARQAYAVAEIQMERALRDSTWTASVAQGQSDPARYRDKPPAVVLDVDETVLDNGAYQARLILDNTSYASGTWKEWVRERQAEPVPGALGFTETAVDRGVQVIYLTNRDADVESATRANLRAHGFPVDDAPDAVLTQSEKKGWGSKQPRREWVAERYRVLLLVGDNFGDFAARVDTSVAARQARSGAFREYWGDRWIVLPNAQYGSWEGALYGFKYGLSPLQRLEKKHRRLDPRR